MVSVNFVLSMLAILTSVGCMVLRPVLDLTAVCLT